MGGGVGPGAASAQVAIASVAAVMSAHLHAGNYGKVRSRSNRANTNG